jgi:glycosyltransferase involved in cell wall biosynthesis
MDKTAYAYSIFVHDDGSTDNTSLIARRTTDSVYTNGQRQRLVFAFQEEINRYLQMEREYLFSSIDKCYIW